MLEERRLISWRGEGWHVGGAEADMLDELLGKAKEDGLVVQEVETHFQFSGY